MTRFQDGPAKGKVLMLRRSPLFLRVVEAAGKWDALDQLDDKPGQHETIHAYRRIGNAGFCRVRMKGGGGFYSSAEYRVCTVQPSDSQMRWPDNWRSWCESAQKNPAI